MDFSGNILLLDTMGEYLPPAWFFFGYGMQHLHVFKEVFYFNH